MKNYILKFTEEEMQNFASALMLQKQGNETDKSEELLYNLIDIFVDKLTKINEEYKEGFELGYSVNQFK